MQHPLNQRVFVLTMVRRIPFTLFTLALLVAAAVGTDSAFSRLTRAWVRRVGFAPRDLGRNEWGRLFSSALVTHGRWTFMSALLAVVVLVGSAELRTSTRRTALTFWSVHLLTLLALMLPIFEKPMARDVGPSAGYYASLGQILTTLPAPQRWIAFTGTLGWLVFALFQPPTNGLSVETKFSADAGHLIAFPLGFAGTLLFSRNR